jgi:hypothetical protein
LAEWKYKAGGGGNPGRLARPPGAG